MENDELYQKALDAAEELFSDTSVTAEQCRNNLNALIFEIETMRDSLEI